MITEQQRKLIQNYLSQQANALTKLMNKLDIGGYVSEGEVIPTKLLKNKKVSFETMDYIRFELAPSNYEMRSRNKKFIRHTQVAWYLLYKMGYTYESIGLFYSKTRPNIYAAVTNIHHNIKKKDPFTVKAYNQFLDKLQPK